MTSLDGRPMAAPPDILAEARDADRRDRLMYELGRCDGYAAGMAAAEREMAEHWAELSRRVRSDANSWTPYAERRRRETERARPSPGDFTGRLTAAQYFGADALADAA